MNKKKIEKLIKFLVYDPVLCSSLQRDFMLVLIFCFVMFVALKKFLYLNELF